MAMPGVITRDSNPAAMQAAAPRPVSPAVQQLGALAKSQNIATAIDPVMLEELGQKVVRETEIDDASRKEWLERNKLAFKLAMQVAEEKTFPWPKAANIKYPLMTSAAIQFAARAYPAIIQGREVVKGQVRGSDEGMVQLDQNNQPVMQPGPVDPKTGQPTQRPVWKIEPGEKQRRADRIGGHMSYQLTEEMEEWEPETDKMLHILPIVGCAFRKTYYDTSLGRNCSDLVTAEDLIVNQSAKTLDRAPRVTHRFSLYPHEITSRTTWLEIEYGTPKDAQPGDEDAPHDFYEQHRWLDLDEDGVREPYIVTVHCETKKVVRIKARFETDGVKADGSGAIISIKPVQYFTKYGFIPSPDGKFYDIGFGWLLYPMNEAVNSTLNRMLDAGTLQNTGGGFIGSGLRIKGGRHGFRPGEYKPVDATGGAIRDNIVTLDHKGPSPVLFNLLGLLIDAAQDISSVKDVMTGGEGPANEAATRTLARIEQGMKVFSAIYKRIYRSMKLEYAKLYRLNALYLDEAGYRDFQDEWQAISKRDYAMGDMDVVPVADPNVVTDMQRLGRAEFMMQFVGSPIVNQVELLERIFLAANIEDTDKLLITEPQPDPEVLARGAEIELDKNRLQLDAEKNTAEIAKLRSDVILNLAKAEAESDKAEIAAISTLLADIMDQRKMAMEARKIDAKESADEGRMGSVESESDN